MYTDPEPQRVAASRLGMVATQHHCATDAGIEMLEEGGNAIDAVVAAALALGVCEPQASGIGGQTMAVLYMTETGRTIALDGSSRSPARAIQDAYERKRELYRGYRATTVPSSLAVYDYALETYGTLPLSRVLEPAIRLAEDGYIMTTLQHRLQERDPKYWEDGNAGDLLLLDGKPVPPGTLFKQPVLAATLRRIAKHGVTDFYQGEIARQIDDDMAKNDGLLRKEDLAQIPWPIARRPLSTRFEGYRVMTMPEPGAGRNLIEMLNILGHFTELRRDPDTPQGALLLAEVMRRAQIDRRDRPFDPNLFQQVEDKRLLSAEYAEQLAKQIKKRIRPKRRRRPRGATPSGTASSGGAASSGKGLAKAPAGRELSGETTHLSVADRHGNFVGLTQSIERVYGSYVITPGLGFLYNDYMSAFEFDDYSHPFYLRPNAVPWASVAPTIIHRGRKPWMVIGSPGSERITTAITQVLLRVLKHQSPFEAVAAPRIHSSPAGRLSLEAVRLRDDIPPLLEKRGFTIDRREANAFYMGCVQVVLREGKMLLGVADPRRDGSAGGPQPTPPAGASAP